jgi:dTDP-4-amino-4,6-dideoxygalactose transaminase
MQSMLDDGIATKRGIMNAHRQPAYRTEPWSCEPGAPRCTCAGGICVRLMASEHAEDRSIMLPLYSQMTVADQDQVVAALTERCA